ncbi:hypothetical protein FVEG_04508 [Fusarium verticillioides 7600]|uniref:Uncharacterized protein n=1 Tax=Gibberella moniliformis (strain M3125 / FGSC 7600) TaxID=334819 RepID=W7MD99_GIBM7|nr:hypothetical protein FVEG_04508 [Fusarium verticillioides 7600]EWG42772.1 hypothetical protein FVEG_04508 [Fusarium verticillioides 7600]
MRLFNSLWTCSLRGRDNNREEEPHIHEKSEFESS